MVIIMLILMINHHPEHQHAHDHDHDHHHHHDHHHNHALAPFITMNIIAITLTSPPLAGTFLIPNQHQGKRHRAHTLKNCNISCSLRVREHPKSGPYVEHLQVNPTPTHHFKGVLPSFYLTNIQWLAVGAVSDVSKILNQGYRHRTTASTVKFIEQSRTPNPKP